MNEKLGRFELLGQIAKGGMAEIYIARQRGVEGFEKLVVVKRLLSHLASRRDVVELFLNEARIAARLSHPNVIQIYDLGKADDSHFIAMEYIQGENLRNVLKSCAERGRILPLNHALGMIKQACEGLYYAHSKTDTQDEPLHIVHCDISPQNILVSFDGGVKVVDFGIARAAATLEQTDPGGTIHGKYGYMSPEQVRGMKLDARSDLFSLGVVLYEACTTRRLFKMDSPIESAKAILQGDVKPPREHNPDIPDSLQDVIYKALSVKPEDRYQTALQMGMAIDKERKALGDESGSLQVGTFMRRLFSEKLKKLKQAEEATSKGEFPSGEWFREDDQSSSMSPFGYESSAPSVQPGASDSVPPGGLSAPVVERTELAFETTKPRFDGPPPRKLPGSGGLGRTAIIRWFVLFTVLLALAVVGLLYLPDILNRPDQTREPDLPIGRASLHSSPVGATVSLNGENKCETPCQVILEKPKEQNHLVLSHSGYQSWETRFSLEQGETVRSFEVQLKKIPKKFGVVEVVTMPPGAKVELDGRLQSGVTPLIIRGVLAKKRHTIRAWIEEDQVWVSTFRLKPRQRKVLRGSLPE